MPSLAAALVPSAVVCADIDFLRPGLAQPFSYGHEPLPADPLATAVFEPHAVVIENARLAPRRASLEHEGAVLVEQASRVRDFGDEQRLRTVYYPESAALIKESTGARRVVVFDHNVRHGTRVPLRPDRYDQGRPVLHAHTDFTPESAIVRLRALLGPQAGSWLRHRIAQFNLWRPITGPLRDSPLAFCDGSSVHPRQLAAVDLLYPDRRGQIHYLVHAPGQRWFYAPDMQPTEAWIFRNYDSAPGTAPAAAPHSAFVDPTHHADVRPRHSIEVRAFALFD